MSLNTQVRLPNIQLVVLSIRVAIPMQTLFSASTAAAEKVNSLPFTWKAMHGRLFETREGSTQLTMWRFRQHNLRFGTPIRNNRRGEFPKCNKYAPWKITSGSWALAAQASSLTSEQEVKISLLTCKKIKQSKKLFWLEGIHETTPLQEREHMTVLVYPHPCLRTN